jgi:predicted kinase
MQPRLYLFVGAPGAGKTTTATIIAKRTGAVHLWADVERHKLFPRPSHTEAESKVLYQKLNNDTNQLLSEGKSVVFDTNFNFYSDRQLLRNLAQSHNAEVVLVWLTTPLNIAKGRAVGTHQQRNGYTIHMSEDQFNAITAKLEPPRPDEHAIQIDGTKLKEEQIKQALRI